MTARIRVRNPDRVQAELKALHDTQMPWREIASLSQYSGIPAGTLCSIANGGEIPKRWRKQLGVSPLAPAPVCPIHGKPHTHNCQPGRKIIKLPRNRRAAEALRDIYVELMSR